VLPQVLAGLGVVSVTSAGCVLWLEQFQPLFATLAVVALGYQSWLVLRRPPQRRTLMMVMILATSLATSLAVAAVLLALSLRYW
jgi:arginine exporter protein ArgO